MSREGGAGTRPPGAPAPSPARELRHGPLILGFALAVLGLLLWRPWPAGIWHDDGVYLILGRALAEGEGLRYVGVPGTPPAPKFPPLYPLLLSLLWRTSPDPDRVAAAATLVNVLLAAAAGALFGRLLRRELGLGAAAALGGAFLAWLSPDLWRPAMLPLSEALYLLLLVGVLAATARSERGDGSAAALALLCGALVLTRTAGVAVVGAAVAGLLLRRRPRPALAAAVAATAVLVPWGLWGRAATASIPGPLRDILGGYGSWMAGQAAGDPDTYLASLPGALAGTAGRLAAILLPGAPPGPGLVLGLGLLGVAGVGLVPLGRRSPGAALALPAMLALAWLWPYQDRRLLAPAIPLLVTAVGFGFAALVRRAPGPAGRGVAVLALAFGVAFAAGGGWRLAGGWVHGPYQVRTRQLAEAVAMVEVSTPGGATVGAPELWAALHLQTGRRAAPSARFRPLTSPSWGTPREQLALWHAARIDHVLLELGGRAHAETLNLLEALCPGSAVIVGRGELQMLVRVELDRCGPAGELPGPED